MQYKILIYVVMRIIQTSPNLWLHCHWSYFCWFCFCSQWTMQCYVMLFCISYHWKLTSKVWSDNSAAENSRRIVCIKLIVKHTVLAQRVGYFVLLYYSHKSLSIFKARGRFEICWSLHFQNTPYIYNFTKFWMRYLRLKTHDTNLLFSW